MSDAKQAILDTMAKHGITLKAVFVPYSKSRNAKQTDERGNPVYSLNWSVTLQRNGRDVLTTDYSAGIGHCPSYNRAAPKVWDRPKPMWQSRVCAWECEEGKAATFTSWGGFKAAMRNVPVPGSEGVSRSTVIRIEPDTASVIASLVLDSSVLDSGGFEDWADECGYDRDSRKAESIYRACLEIALKLRSGIGQDALTDLATAAQDY
jgi:hypothetical protein